MGQMTPDPSLQGIFETEVSEWAGTMQEHLLRIEQGVPDREERLADLLRLAHDAKGAARIMGAKELAALAHALESRLMGWRGGVAADATGMDLALAVCDLMPSLAADVKPAAAEDAPALERRARVDALCSELAAAPAEREDTGGPGGPSASNASNAPTLPIDAGGTIGAGGTSEPGEPRAEAAGPRPPQRAPARAESLRVGRQRVDAVVSHVAYGLAHAKVIEERYRVLRDAKRRLQMARLPSVHDNGPSLIRTRNELECSISEVNHAIRQLGDALRRFVSDLGGLDAAAYEISLVSCGPMVGQLERAARDAGALLGRRLRLEVAGRDIELDKALVEELKGPLVHAVRNAVDHGLETPSERLAAGKDPVGLVELTLTEDQDSLQILLRDDGRGIDRAAVRARLGPSADGLDDRALLERLLRSGISTRDEATEISGRGIGLGALAALADRLRGDATLTSQPGHGTTVALRLPLRVSQLVGLHVESGGVQVVLPYLRVSRVDSADDVDDADEVPALASLLGLPAGGPTAHVVTLVGRERRGGRFGVTRLFGRREVVQRPVGPHLERVPFVSGVTVLPNGGPALILDPRELVDARPDDPDARRKRRILLVDDSKAIRTVIHAHLAGAGYDVVLADDGRTALDRLEAMSFDAIVSDVQMPRLDGFGVLAHVAGRLPIILVTSEPGPEVERRARDGGAAAFLVKDATVGSRVEAVLADVLSRKLESRP